MDKQDLLDKVIDRIKHDLLDGDESPINELLNFISENKLIEFLPERDWEKYKSLIQNKDEGQL